MAGGFLVAFGVKSKANQRAERDLRIETVPLQQPEPPAAVPAPAAVGPKVNVNTADSANLQVLPGVGPVIAERIIWHRRAYGPFKRPEDLLAVPGIGQEVLQKMLPCLEF